MLHDVRQLSSKHSAAVWRSRSRRSLLLPLLLLLQRRPRARAASAGWLRLRLLRRPHCLVRALRLLYRRRVLPECRQQLRQLLQHLGRRLHKLRLCRVCWAACRRLLCRCRRRQHLQQLLRNGPHPKGGPQVVLAPRLRLRLSLHLRLLPLLAAQRNPGHVSGLGGLAVPRTLRPPRRLLRLLLLLLLPLRRRRRLLRGLPLRAGRRALVPPGAAAPAGC